MGIELHPKSISLTEPRRYQRSKSQLLPFDAKCSARVSTEALTFVGFSNPCHVAVPQSLESL